MQCISLLISLIIIISFNFKSNYVELVHDYKSLYNNYIELKYNYGQLNQLYLDSSAIIPDNFINLNFEDEINYYIIGLFNSNNCGKCIHQMIIELEIFKADNKFNNILIVSNIKRKGDFFKPYGFPNEDDYLPYRYLEIEEMSSSFNNISSMIVVMNQHGI